MLLNCHTYFSFRYGTLSIDALLSEVKQKGYDRFVLSDINNTSACLDTIRKAKEQQVHVIAGIDFRNGVEQRYVGIARNNEGFKELNTHLSLHLHSDLPFEDTAPEFNHAYIIYPLRTYKGWPLRGHEFIGVSPDDLRRILFSPYRHLQKKFVVLHQVSFADGKDLRHYEMHRLLRCIGENTVLSKLGKNEQATGTEYLPVRQALYDIYAAYPLMIANTEALLNDCSIDFEYGKLKNKNLKYYRANKSEDMQLLHEKCREGLSYRYSIISPQITERVEKELKVIEELNFASYFLINWDITNYAQRQGYYHVGRGSGANSIVAYLLRITDVDPIELDLYFERFINIHRSNAPDFDIDFSWTDRDDITAYIFKRFNRNGNVALLGAYNTFKKDAAIHQLGKVFGLPPNEIEQLKKARTFKPDNKLQHLVMSYAGKLNNFPSHLSIHSSGIIISEAPVHCYSATSLPPKGYPTTQFSMLEAEDIGLYKFDILSQRGLGKIKDTLQIVKKSTGREIDIHNIEPFKKDEKVKALLREGKAIGCFYVESPAMRMLLTKLKADDYLRLVAASSIIRPGVAQSGMMREYIVRFREPELRKKAEQKLPHLYDLLRETYGVMVYQEDVIRVAHIFAGLSLAKADYLRRGMSWKFKERSEFGKVRNEFFTNCYAKGYDHSTVLDIWNQIESFANFAFSKGHSASYAVESYQALYLKAHYPVEYMVATLNNGGGFYHTELYIHEARQHGATITTPCINRSTMACSVEGKNVYLGLQMIQGSETEALKYIIGEREENGAFTDLTDFVKRLPHLTLEQTRLLIRAGTFAFTGRNKKELLWEIHMLLRPDQKTSGTHSLFERTVKSWAIPQLSHSKFDDAFDERELFGFSMLSPFEMLKDQSYPKLTARELRQMVNREVRITGYLVNVKNTQTLKDKNRMNFGTFIDENGEWIDTVHFPESAAKFPFTGSGCYHIKGKVTEEYDFVSIEVSEMKRIPMVDREKWVEE